MMNGREQLFAEIREAGLRAAKEGRLAAAIELLNEYLKHRPDDGAVWFRFGDAVREIGLKDEAEGALLKALELTSVERRGGICMRLGLLHHDAGRYGQAEEFYARSCKDPEFGAYGSTWIMRGANLASMNSLMEAEKCHRHALTFFDEHVDRDEAYLNLGYVLRAQGRYVNAREAFANALAITPDYGEAREAAESLVGVEEAMKKVKELNDRLA